MGSITIPEYPYGHRKNEDYAYDRHRDMQTMRSDELIDELTYINYAHNRDLAPGITPERWKKVYGAEAVEKMEARLQAERGKVAA